MRLRLDECVPRRLGRELADHEVLTVQQAGWSGLGNGRLLEVAQRRFDVFVTVDQGLRYQQDISGFQIAIVVLEAPTNDIEDLRPLMPRVRELLPQLRPGQLVRVADQA